MRLAVVLREVEGDEVGRPSAGGDPGDTAGPALQRLDGHALRIDAPDDELAVENQASRHRVVPEAVPLHEAGRAGPVSGVESSRAGALN
ncbi:hypothetical protein ACFQ77_26030, partial [Streptomyces virginiae]|uniref:hypothetical protein n=1 Tax=Streptomyces virginiae TaxID=1961 RepID=UPI0036737B94